jgi:hypothetical protein
MVGRRMSGRGWLGDLGEKAGDWAEGKVRNWLGFGRKRRVRRRRPMVGGMLMRPKIVPIFGMRRRRRRMAGRGVGGSIGRWLADRAGGLIGLGRRRRRRFALGRRPMTYVGSARRSRSRYA